MKCQILFSGKNKKNINLSSAENAQRVVKVKTLKEHRNIDQAWYFNGSVYGKTIAGKRYKFELFDTVDDDI